MAEEMAMSVKPRWDGLRMVLFNLMIMMGYDLAWRVAWLLAVHYLLSNRGVGTFKF